MQKRNGMRLLALMLSLAIILAMGVPAFAEGRYAADQSYTQDKSLEDVYTVKLRSTAGESCEELRGRLLEAGFDAFVYVSGDKSVVMCGKFRSLSDAVACREEIDGAVENVKTYLGSAWLPAEAIDAFEAGPQESEPAAVAAQENAESEVYTVALSTLQDRAKAEELVKALQNAGFDAFIQDNGGSVRLLSGKFRDVPSALRYRDCIWSNTSYADTIIVTVPVPESEILAFTEDYEKNGLPGPVKDNLEKPTGAFYREKNGQVQAFTVQFSAGYSFSGAERRRDAMIAAGYPAFVYERGRVYMIMTGAFSNRADADAYCQQIKDNTVESDAYVTTAWLPSSIVK